MPTTDKHSNTALQAASEPAARTAPPIRRFGAQDTVSWAGTALPLVACAAIWGIGDASPAGVAWLTVAHGAIGTVASAWTVVQLALIWRTPRASRKAVLFWPRPRLLLIYALLVLQPLFAIASGMLHGDHVTLFGIPLPSVLPKDQHAALQLDRLHGGQRPSRPDPDCAASRGHAAKRSRDKATDGNGAAPRPGCCKSALVRTHAQPDRTYDGVFWRFLRRRGVMLRPRAGIEA